MGFISRFHYTLLYYILFYMLQGMDIELTPEEYKAIRAREILYDRMQQVDPIIDNFFPPPSIE
ncbi:hypothetical protein Scep_007276 [Stephania cephalantha]|uniref:Uncharacterized protein n=1 Tax=Stephania cephalantha TaxID=152367 RepID=A0AAP0KBJ5_9MAGN